MNRGSIVDTRVNRKAVWGGKVGRLARLMVAVGLAVISASCGDLVRQGTGSSYLTMDLLQARSGNTGTFGTTLQSDVVTDSGSIFSDSGQATLTLQMKDPTGPAPSTVNFITIDRYRVRFTRADGRNTPGVDVPWGFDGAVTVTVSGTATIPFELIRHVAKEEAPLAALGTNFGVIISTIAEITFFGHDQAGRDVSVSGQMLVSFGNFAG